MIKRIILKYKTASFITIFILTILIARILTSITDPNIIIKGFELHHFYYGLTLLIIASIMMLYKRGNLQAHLVITSIAIALIVDELIFLSGKIRGPITYSSTIPATIIISIALFVLIGLINHRK